MYHRKSCHKQTYFRITVMMCATSSTVQSTDTQNKMLTNTATTLEPVDHWRLKAMHSLIGAKSIISEYHISQVRFPTAIELDLPIDLNGMN